MLGKTAFDYVIDYPAWLLGSLLGGLAYLAVTAGGLICAIYAGMGAYRMIRLPALNWIVAIVVGLWVALVSFRSLSWMAAGVFSAIEHRNDE